MPDKDPRTETPANHKENAFGNLVGPVRTTQAKCSERGPSVQATKSGGDHALGDDSRIHPSASVDETFESLRSHITQFDPIKLLCSLSLTYLSHPESDFVGEGDEIHRWIVRLELIAGLLLSQPHPTTPQSEVTGSDLVELEHLIELYEASLLKASVRTIRTETDNAAASLLGSVRNYSHWVRGTAYLHQYRRITHDIYSPHDDWFEKNLGFTIDEATYLVESWIKEYDARINQERIAAKQYAFNEVANSVPEDRRTDLEPYCFMRRYLSRAYDFFGFSVDELSSLSNLPMRTCSKILERLSQTFGYKHPKFPDAFRDGSSAPWDFNTLHERPLVCYGQRYWMVIPAIVHPVLMNTFYFDLMSDRNYRPEFERFRGQWLEAETARCLGRIFNKNEVLLNPCYPNGNEMADVLVLHDGTAMIVQCKSKGLTLAASTGKSSQELKSSLEKAVKNAYMQGARARRFILEHTQVTLCSGSEKSERVINTEKIYRVLLIVVTAAPLQFLATKWSSINDEMHLFPQGDYPWVSSIADLDVVTDILPCAARFIHYLKRRLEMEERQPNIYADELDLLGMYLIQGLRFDSERARGMDLIGLSGMSTDIDEYMFRRHTLGQDLESPAVSEPSEFTDLVVAISQREEQYKLEVALGILDLSEGDKVEFMRYVDGMIKRTNEDGLPHNFSIRPTGTNKALLFISMDAHGDYRTLCDRIAAHACVKVGQGHCSEICAIGCDISTTNVVDAVFYLAVRTADRSR